MYSVLYLSKTFTQSDKKFIFKKIFVRKMFLCNPYQRNQHNEAGSDVLKASSEIQHVSTTATTSSQASATENVNPILPGNYVL